MKFNDENRNTVSILSRQIEESLAQEETSGDNDYNSGLPLTIYLPDTSSIMVNVKETSNFQEVVLQILKAHEKQGVQPPLDYNDPGMYELRIHEGTGLLLQYHCHRCELCLLDAHCVTGDGEPDRDFPALDPSKLLSDFNLDEYCLCVVEGRRRAATGPSSNSTGSTGPRATVNTTMDTATFSPSFGARNVSSGLSVPSASAGGTAPATGGMRHSSSAGQLSVLTGLSSSGNSGSGSGSGGKHVKDDAADLYNMRRDRENTDRARSQSKQTDDSFENTVRDAAVQFSVRSGLIRLQCLCARIS
jgi:hypothetical protein